MGLSVWLAVIAISSSQVDLSAYEQQGTRTIEFSADSKLVYVRLRPYEGTQGRPHDLVFDLSGHPFKDACDEQGRIKQGVLHRFPKAAADVVAAEFLKGTRDGGGVSKDRRYGLRHLGAGVAEIWQLEPDRRRIATAELPAHGGRLELTEWFERNGEKYVLLVFSFSKAIVLSAKDGSVVQSIDYGALLTDPEERFHAHTFAFDPTRRLLACGDFEGQRVRVISLDRPEQIVFEANTYAWQVGIGGAWMVSSVNFSPSGFLVVEYCFAGRLTLFAQFPTEVFRIDDWTRVWRENSLWRTHVTLSPDGKWIAFFPNRSLEIRPFVAAPLPKWGQWDSPAGERKQ